MTRGSVRILRAQRFWVAARAILPATVGTFTWGVIAGVALVKAGLTVPQAVGMTLMVFSGTTQLAALPLMVSGASIVLITLTAVLTGLRFVVYSASLASDLGRLPWFIRLPLGYLTTDSGLALYHARRARLPRAQRTAFFLGCNAPVWLAWQVGSLLGIAAAAALPGSASLSYLALLAVLAIVVQMVASRAALVTVCVAAAVAPVFDHLPYRSGMMLAILCAVVAALWLDRGQTGRSDP